MLTFLRNFQGSPWTLKGPASKLGLRYQTWSLTFWAAGLLVVDANNQEFLAAYQKLLRRTDIPPLLRSGLADGRILKHYLLLSYDSGQSRYEFISCFHQIS